uniref:STAS domain-containing protein n=1 Tax=Heterorhabditis bacteriophora TaxID=37862 RepID=A0A1I7XNC5_HETBA
MRQKLVNPGRSFAVVALMAGLANDNVMVIRGGGIIEVSANGTVTTQYSITPIQVAATLTFAMGIWQVLCGLLRLQFLMAYFSDPLVSGFTTGYLFVRVYDIIIRLPQSNIAAIVVSIVSMVFLYTGKTYLSPFLGRKYNLKLPIPYELILNKLLHGIFALKVSVSAALSALLSWHSTHNLEIVGEIPAGLPRPEMPIFSILKECLIQSIGIAIVTIAVHISMAKMLAKKLNYSIDDNQELYALGFSGILGGFLPVYPVSTALGRTMVNVNSGTKTQLSTIFSCALLITIILWLGPLLKDLPKCVLASIITVALKSMFMKCGELKKLYPISKTDFAIWIISFLTTMCIDVMGGLAISIFFALFTVICRSQWPKWQFFIYSPKIDDNGKTKIDSVSSEISIFRFDGPLLFTNVESSENVDDKETKKVVTEPPRFFIIDCSAMAYVDFMGINTLKEVAAIFHIILFSS